MTYAWDEERVELIHEHWAAGRSAAQIARSLFDKYGEPLTRNSVIGKLLRTDAPKRMNPDIASVKAVKRIAEKRGKRISRTSPIIPKTSRHKPINVTPETVRALHTPLAELTPWTCRAVASTEVWGQPTYCGHAITHEGASYCAEHAARFYVTIEKKPRRLGASGVNRRADYRDSARWGAR